MPGVVYTKGTGTAHRESNIARNGRIERNGERRRKEGKRDYNEKKERKRKKRRTRRICIGKLMGEKASFRGKRKLEDSQEPKEAGSGRISHAIIIPSQVFGLIRNSIDSSRPGFSLAGIIVRLTVS